MGAGAYYLTAEEAHADAPSPRLREIDLRVSWALAQAAVWMALLERWGSP